MLDFVKAFQDAAPTIKQIVDTALVSSQPSNSQANTIPAEDISTPRQPDALQTASVKERLISTLLILFFNFILIYWEKCSYINPFSTISIT